jgi:hypothetical protein
MPEAEAHVNENNTIASLDELRRFNARTEE